MKKVVLSAALAIVSGAAFAQMTAVEDEVLSAQTGQDGISIAMNVKAHIDSFEWIDNGAGPNGGSVKFEDIAIGSGALSTQVASATFTGLNNVADVTLAARHEYAQGIAFGGPIKIDVEQVGAFGNLTNAAAVGAAVAEGSVNADDVAAVQGGARAVAISIPRTVMSFNVNAIRVGNATSEGVATVEGESMGGIRMTNLDFKGTKVLIWGHK